jgi:hypothetical protein
VVYLPPDTSGKELRIRSEAARTFSGKDQLRAAADASLVPNTELRKQTMLDLIEAEAKKVSNIDP